MNKSPESNAKNEPHDELRQQLWELSYGLLEDDAAAALRATVTGHAISLVAFMAARAASGSRKLSKAPKG